MKELLRAVLIFVLLLTALAPCARAAQTAGVSKEEAAEARAVASAFAERLLESHDFAAVVRELYAEDFMARRLAGESAAAGPHSSTFMLEGVPSLTFSQRLAAEGGAEDWRRLYVAADNLMNFVYLSLMSGRSLQDLGDPEKYDDGEILDVFTPEAKRVLASNPMLANLLIKRGAEVVVGTPKELRAAADALEEAVRLTRPRFAEILSKGKHLGANLRLMKEASARDAVTSADADAEELGYAKGARLFRAFAPNGYMLLLVKQGGAMRVAWATLPHD